MTVSLDKHSLTNREIILGGDDESAVNVRIWDLPLRIFHWVLLLGFGLLWWTAEIGQMYWHQRVGYGVTGLLVFRLYWGVWGSPNARFSRFIVGPRAIAAYTLSLVRGPFTASSGHNPLGACSVMLLLSMLTIQALSGLFAVPVDGITSGPLSRWVNYDMGAFLAEVHATNFIALLYLIGLHFLAVLYYEAIRRERLIGAMLHGCKTCQRETCSTLAEYRTRQLVWGIIFAALVAIGVAFGFRF